MLKAGDSHHSTMSSDDSVPDPENSPVVSCTRCDHTWDLDYEFEELQAGNRALEQFAIDHERHTGHYPDDVRPWTVVCERCPATEQYLSARPARRWANTHARHTRHQITLTDPNGEQTEIHPSQT